MNPMSSTVAIRSFGAETATAEVVSRLEQAGIPCSLLSAHYNIPTHMWLFVSREHVRLARETLRSLPSGKLQGSVALVRISESDIPVYATKLADRYRIRWLPWLLIVFWPAGLGLGLWWAFISLCGFLIAVVLLSRIVDCPCCRKGPMKVVDEFVQCSRCGLRCVR